MAKKPQERVKPGTSKDAAMTRKAMFADAYIANGGNATNAAKTAGYSEVSAHTTGYRLLKDADVISMIDSRRADIAKKYRLDTESIVRNLAQAVYFDPRKLLNEDGSVKPIQELDDDTAMALAGFEVTEFVGKGEDPTTIITKKVKWLDKNTARDQAMKHLGMFRVDNEQKKPDPIEGIPTIEVARRVGIPAALWNGRISHAAEQKRREDQSRHD